MITFKRNLRRALNEKIYSDSKKKYDQSNISNINNNYYSSSQNNSRSNSPVGYSNNIYSAKNRNNSCGYNSKTDRTNILEQGDLVENNDTADDTQIKNEAKMLIEKTKQMMRELSLDKVNDKIPKSLNLTTSADTKKTNYNLKIYPNSNNFSQISNLNSVSNISIDSITKKLLEKNKQLKNYERELKEKTAQLKQCQDKLLLKNKEIEKLNETLTLEKSNNLKADNIKLQRKIYNLEKTNSENKKIYEKLIEEHKLTINDLTNKNNNLIENLNNSENNNIILSQEIENLKNEILQNNNNLKTLNEKYDILEQTNKYNVNQNESLKVNLSNLIILIKTLYGKENDFYQRRKNFLDKFNCTFQGHGLNSNISFMNSQISNNNLNNEGNIENDEANNSNSISNCENNEYENNRIANNNINLNEYDLMK